MLRLEVKNYLINCFKAMRSVLLALAVGLMFMAVDVISSILSGEKILWSKTLSVPVIFSVACFLNVWLAICLFKGVLLCVQIRRGRAMKVNFLITFLVSFVGMISGLISARYLLAIYLGRIFSLNNMGGAFLIGTFITLMFLFYFYYKNSLEENLKLKALNAENELHVLKNQLRPHFLFNTLNGLSELIASDPATAGSMAQMLADLYREILENSKHKTIPISAEIALVEKYVQLEKKRYGGRLEFFLTLTADGNQYMPALLIQTLVENAIKHGISPSVKGGKIMVSVVPKNQGIQICVENTGSSYCAVGPGKGTGLANSQARLQLLYGERHGFKIEGGATTLATFWISGEKIV
ncbi:MAG: hypothetical protein A2X86_21980 [Bdellovibrionales bacterium GWA2_49_15]|nr:MAG: hypothetical protein A2X86_21980 [Bdellovibrionales bacterium GWA2_49_15]HAZ15004.1 hypothetical protein [Bdellovibrionales bacterium]